MTKSKGVKMKNKVGQDTEPNLKRLIGKRIQKIRNRLGKPAKWVAGQMQINRSTLSQMETGTIHINAVALYKLAYVLKCDVREFFPTVPDSSSLTERDVALLAQEDTQAAEFLKKAFKQK